MLGEFVNVGEPRAKRYELRGHPKNGLRCGTGWPANGRRMLTILISEPTESRYTMKGTLVVALALMTGALGGCATSVETKTNAPPVDALASPMTSPAPLPGNVFLPSPGPHYHGSMGP
jgi:hypothetical protein